MLANIKTRDRVVRLSRDLKMQENRKLELSRGAASVRTRPRFGGKTVELRDEIVSRLT